MRTWIGFSTALVVVIGLHTSAWANSELHGGGRLFYPLWDVSTPNRITLIIVTRQAMREGASVVQAGKEWRINGDPGKCLPRGANGSDSDVNRTDLGGTSANPVFVDDVHFRYYGRSCASADEIVHMSCADIDVFLLASPDNAGGTQPRSGFEDVAGELRGALDVHLITNGTGDPRQRKAENSLMGEAIIVDPAEGWAANYDAAAAKAVDCSRCDEIDGGTPVGYENYPMEVYLPFALPDGSPTQGGNLRNILSLWGPGLLPAANLEDFNFVIDFKWWDGRERPFTGSAVTLNGHSIIRPLGGGAVTDPDVPLDSARFRVENFVCGHTTDSSTAENDGLPRSGASATACSLPPVLDLDHRSDTIENSGDINVAGHTIQSSVPIGWWRFKLRRDNIPPAPLPGLKFFHSGRGLVGVVLSSAPGAQFTGMSIATRLWHEDSCEIAQSGETVGPPHKGYGNISNNDVALFNAFGFGVQKAKCHLLPIP